MRNQPLSIVIAKVSNESEHICQTAEPRGMTRHEKSNNDPRQYHTKSRPKPRQARQVCWAISRRKFKSIPERCVTDLAKGELD
jgi:hypothetical protein